MPKVICKLPNASELISGVKFVSHKLGVISEEIEQEVADAFLAIEGYILAGKPSAEAAKAKADADAKAAADAKAEADELAAADAAKDQTPAIDEKTGGK